MGKTPRPWLICQCIEAVALWRGEAGRPSGLPRDAVRHLGGCKRQPAATRVGYYCVLCNVLVDFGPILPTNRKPGSLYQIAMRVIFTRAARSMRQTGESKPFVFAKKNQKTLVHKALALPRRVRQMDKSFCFFFQKKCFLPSMPQPQGNLVLQRSVPGW